MIVINKRFFIHKIDLKSIKNVIKEKELNFFEKIKPNDDIVFCTEFNNQLLFIGYTEVKDIDGEKLLLKGVKFFLYPIVNNKFPIDDTNYSEISINEFKFIKPSKSNIIKSFPWYLNNPLSISYDKFEKYCGDAINNLINKIPYDYEFDFNCIFNQVLLNYGISDLETISDDFVDLNMDNSKVFIQNLTPEMLDDLYKYHFLDINHINSDNIKRIKKDDYILFFTNLGKLSFVAIGLVDYNLYTKFDCKFINKSLKFRKIFYFTEPVEIVEIKDNLSIKTIKSVRQYVKILKSDVLKIIENINLVYDCPPYLKRFNENFKNFIKLSINNIFYIINNICNIKQIKIKKFLSYLKIFLSSFNIHLNLNELEEFYSCYAFEIGFKHSPSLGSDIIVPLRLKNGRTIDMCYINF